MKTDVSLCEKFIENVVKRATRRIVCQLYGGETFCQISRCVFNRRIFTKHFRFSNRLSFYYDILMCFLHEIPYINILYTYVSLGETLYPSDGFILKDQLPSGACSAASVLNSGIYSRFNDLGKAQRQVYAGKILKISSKMDTID